jgi:hypothetical protein
MFSYNEDKSLEKIKQYIESTYGEHYVNTDGGKHVQVQDILIAAGHAESFYIGNALKYIARYGKKSGRNEKDLMKAVHYITLLMDLSKEQK